MRLIFAHIPKTAGTSVRVHLLPNFAKEDRVYVAYVGGEVGPDKFPTYSIRENWKFLTGHIRISRLLSNPHIDPSDTEIVLLSFVRDPIERLVSLYNYVLTQPKHQPKNHELAMNLGPIEYIRQQDENLQSDFLSRNGENIAWKIMIAPVTRVAPACNQAIEATTGKPPKNMTFPVRNVSAGRAAGTISKNDLPSDFIAELYERNARDKELFNTAQSTGLVTKLPD